MRTALAADAPTLHSSDSSLAITGDVPAGSSWVWLKTSHDPEGVAYDLYLHPDGDGHFSGRLYLTQGPGIYHVMVLYRTAPEKMGDYWAQNEVLVENDDPRDMSFLLPSQEVQSDAPEIISLAAQIAKEASTDLEKARAIHDWVAHHIRYDLPASKAGDPGDQSALHTLQSGQGVCEGFAAMVAALSRAAGLRAKIIDGAAIWLDLGQTWDSIPDPATINHSWNEVWVDGRWVVEDATWDAGAVVNNGPWVAKFSSQYFDPNAPDFARDHRKVSESAN